MKRSASTGRIVSRLRRVVRWLRVGWDRLRSGYWLVPTACALLSVFAAVGLIALDRYLADRGTPAWTYAGGPQNASDTLSTIASSMITFTGLVFSITVLALQLTSSQFSPRALRNFLRDPVAQLSLGIFVGTFAYAFAALSAVRVASEGAPSFVPAITVTGAFALIALSLLMFVRYIHHMANSIRVVSIVERIADETTEVIERLYAKERTMPASAPTHGRPSTCVAATRAGVIVGADVDALASEASRCDAFVRVLHPVGAFVCEGQPLLDVASHDDEVGADRWLRCIDIAAERTMRADALFGFRQLVDIAERALSPGINDPTTAVQCLDRLHDLLRRLLGRDLPAWRVAHHDGVARVWMPAATFEEHVTLATEEIQHWGSSSLQVRRRMLAMLDELLGAARHDDERRCLEQARWRLVLDERAR